MPQFPHLQNGVDNGSCLRELLFSSWLHGRVCDLIEGCPLPNQISPVPLRGRECSHFIDYNTEAYRDNIICPGANKWRRLDSHSSLSDTNAIIAKCDLGQLTSPLQASVPHLLSGTSNTRCAGQWDTLNKELSPVSGTSVLSLLLLPRPP